jgi:hypothetical protein
MPLVLRIAAFAFLMFGVSACGETSNVLTAGTPAPATTRAPLTTPAVAGLFTPQPGSAFFGAFVNTTGLLNGSTPEDVALVEQQLGRQLLLHMILSITASRSSRGIANIPMQRLQAVNTICRSISQRPRQRTSADRCS